MNPTSSCATLFDMTQLKINSAYNQFAFFHQNEALLYQYMVHEALHTSQALQAATPDQALFESLMGLPAQNWQGRSGHLQKLNQCILLLNSQFPHADHSFAGELAKLSEKAIQIANKCSLLLIKKSPDLNKPYAQLQNVVKKISLFLLQNLSLFQDHEQVLFFILKSNKRIEALFGKSFLNELFSSLFPGGFDEGITYVSEQYAQKGFHHLLPQLEKYREHANA